MKAFYDPARWKWTRMLEEHWPAIREEAARLEPESFIPWPNQSMYSESWSLFGFYGFGRRFDLMCDACPRTAALVEKIPGMTSAVFSAMGPGAHLPALRGATRAVLRCHLGVIVPDGARIRVEDETRPWEEGPCTVFDDCCEHDVWNDSDQRRINLIVDFWRPWSIPGDYWTRIKHRLALQLNLKRSDVLEFVQEQHRAQEAKKELLEKARDQAREDARR